jgi:hypothetical protein
VVGLLLWVGLFGIVWELLRARKHGVAVTRAEKLYLAMALPLILCAQLVLESLVGIPQVPTAGIALAIALNGWVLNRRIQRLFLHLCHRPVSVDWPCLDRTEVELTVLVIDLD